MFHASRTSVPAHQFESFKQRLRAAGFDLVEMHAYNPRHLEWVHGEPIPRRPGGTLAKTVLRSGPASEEVELRLILTGDLNTLQSPRSGDASQSGTEVEGQYALFASLALIQPDQAFAEFLIRTLNPTSSSPVRPFQILEFGLQPSMDLATMKTTAVQLDAALEVLKKDPNVQIAMEALSVLSIVGNPILALESTSSGNRFVGAALDRFVPLVHELTAVVDATVSSLKPRLQVEFSRFFHTVQ